MIIKTILCSPTTSSIQICSKNFAANLRDAIDTTPNPITIQLQSVVPLISDHLQRLDRQSALQSKMLSTLMQDQSATQNNSEVLQRFDQLEDSIKLSERNRRQEVIPP